MMKCDFNRVIDIALQNTYKNNCEGGCFWLSKCKDPSLKRMYRGLPKSRDHGEIKFVDKIYPQFIFADAKYVTNNLTPGT